MKLNPYPKYKDSGVQWIGEVPEDWKVQRGKFQFKVTGGYAFPSDDFVEEGISLVRIGDVSEGTVNLDNCKKLPEEYALTKKDFLLNEKEVLVAMTGATIGKIGQVPKTSEKMLLNQRVGRVKTKFSSDYYKYVLTADFIKEQIRLIAEGAAQENISSEQIESFVIPKLDEENHKNISSFLDSKTSQLDQTIEKDKQLIELLKEKRTALINHVVTKGLDKNAKMKNSGIDFIDEIPEHWEINKLTNFIDLKHGHQFREEDFVDEGLKIVKIGQLKDEGIIDLSNCSFIDEDRKREFRSVLLKEGDVLMALSGATVGKVARIDFPIKDTFQNYRVGNFLSLGKMDKHFIYYILLSNLFNFQMYLYIAQTAQENIGKKDFKKIIITIPPTEEQTQIVQYLDKETSKIDKTIKKIEEKINLMEEYKKSLIHHVVTGKVDVRGEK